MLSCVQDAKENRDVATVDLPGAFMHADMDDTVHIKLVGKMAELLVMVDPKLYRKYIKFESWKPVLYARLQKALYGTLKAALRFWKLLSKTLKRWGFAANPYDPCIVNKLINGSQCTILWHVDDLKISHKDAKVVTSIIGKLNKEFGEKSHLTVTRGKVHEYLGMIIDCNIPGKVKISMKEYIKSMLKDLPDDMNGESVTPAGNHLFQVDHADVKLPEETAIIFHHNTAKLLFLCKRARPDIQPPVAFLCTRVKEPDQDDYKTLAGPCDAILTGFCRYGTNFGGFQHERGQVVGGRLVRGPSRHAKPYWHGNVYGERINILLLDPTEDQYSEFDRGRTSRN
jgi:Reverse transcriptase (RNA-dependent DNA polymerase)